eukprot:4320024-Pyramimonas_sp.AAC.1
MEVRPRDLVDDVALSWPGLDPGGSRFVATACRVFCESARTLGLILQLDKSGHLALTRQTADYVKSFARLLNFAGRRRVRYLGHDVGAAAAARGAQMDRLKKMHGMKARIRTLQRGAGCAKAARIWTGG